MHFWNKYDAQQLYLILIRISILHCIYTLYRYDYNT